MWVYIKKALLCFVSFCFLILTLWFYYCIFQSFFLDQKKNSEKVLCMSGLLARDNAYDQCGGRERSMRYRFEIFFNPVRRLDFFGVNLSESSLSEPQFPDAVESIYQHVTAEDVCGGGVMVLPGYMLFLLPVLALAFFLVQVQHTELSENKTKQISQFLYT